MGTGEFLFEDESRQIIGACYEVHNTLGHGFLESVYQEALAIVFEEKGIPYQKETKLEIWFHNRKLNKAFYADFICFGSIIIELKACESLSEEHISQVLNYLKATKYRLGLLINFGTQKVQIKRVIL